ncbi:MAG: acetyl-CoA carboxylase biotin carboxyl carrier protein [Candidatus Coatesbacteria bacterium]|nr:MAG: acetyl-CoA carboxylase biotin carboxyl carrier protein [Candidatus Coatesbacteria bacterium]
MDINFIRRLVDILEENDLFEIEVSTLFRKVRVSRGAAIGSVVGTVPAQAAGPAVSAPVAEEAAAAEEEELGLVEVTSPMVGTFYRAASPDAEPYVEEGQYVEKGAVICIIEAMKIMNEIESEYNGTIRKIKISNAEPVEYGQALMTIKPG